MNYTKKFKQVSKNAARAKFARMAASMGRQASVSSFECGFSTWWWGKDEYSHCDNPDSYEEYFMQPNNPDSDDYAIFVNSNYHVESTLDEMYKTNCKNW